MTEAEALDEAAKAAGWRDWKTLQLIARPDKQDDIRRHAKTIMENAALKAENERIKALRDDDGELLTIAWMDGAHRSNKAHREKVAALKAENERLREALRIYAGPMEWTQEGGWGVFPVWADGYPGGVYVDDNTLDYGDAARAALKEIEGD